jgi:phenylacetate-CoA ligase
MMPRDELEQLQIERLQSTLNRVYRSVAFYRTAFDTHRVNLEKIKTLAALRELPFTTREDLQKSYPYDMFAVPLHDIVRIHSTLGTMGKPIVVGYTRNDLRNWTECTARLLSAAGITPHDVVQIAAPYDLFATGFGFHQGAEQIGASVIPASTSTRVDRQVVIMRDFKTTALICTPGYAVQIIAGMDELSVHPERLNLRLGLFGGERWSDTLRAQMEQRLHIVAMDHYGLTEIMGSGIAGECSARDGLHINEDHFIAEIINPKTLSTAGFGEEGELVLTTITKEGFPLIRYRTGDLTRLLPDSCPCGRTLLRMARVSGRTDDLIQIHGVGFFPSQIEQILSEIEGASPYYQIVLDQQNGIDRIEIRVEISDAIPSLDELKTLETLRGRMTRGIKTTLGLEARIVFVEPNSLRQLGTGAGRIDDRRPR